MALTEQLWQQRSKLFRKNVLSKDAWNKGLHIKKISRKIITCACNCNQTREVKISSNQKYINGHNNRGQKRPEHSKRMTGINNPMFGKVVHNKRFRAGYRTDLGHYVRSRWEANICRIHKFKNEHYEYEPKTFAFEKEQTSYTPDIKNGYWKEIKGHAESSTIWTCDCEMCQVDKRKIALFKTYYPHEKLEIIGQKEYAKLRNSYKHLIAWEE